MDQEEFDLMPEEAPEEDTLDPNNPDDAFAILERNYLKTVAEMEENHAAAKYLEEFNKLFDYLHNIREQGIYLSEQNKIISEELAVTDEQLQNNREMIKTDTKTITRLETDIEQSRKLIDNAHSREQHAQEIIDNLRKQIQALENEIELQNKMAAPSFFDENPQVAKQRAGIAREKDALKIEVAKLTEKLNNALMYQEELEQRTSVADLQVVAIGEEMEVCV